MRPGSRRAAGLLFAHRRDTGSTCRREQAGSSSRRNPPARRPAASHTGWTAKSAAGSSRPQVGASRFTRRSPRVVEIPVIDIKQLQNQFHKWMAGVGASRNPGDRAPGLPFGPAPATPKSGFETAACHCTAVYQRRGRCAAAKSRVENVYDRRAELAKWGR